MTAKTKKELHAENVLLKEQLADMKTKFSELTEKYKNMKQNKLIPSFKCHRCSKNFDCSEDLKKHMIKHGDKSDTFNCDLCDSKFYEEWKMLAHKKTHTKFNCEKCYMTFNYQLLKEKHMHISHGNKLLYCHYFNNKKKCPYKENCMYIHDDSEKCKYDSKCARNLCMYKHSCDQAETILEKFDCDACGFVTTDKKEFELHLDEVKRTCPVCKKDYDCVDYMKEHLDAVH